MARGDQLSRQWLLIRLLDHPNGFTVDEAAARLGCTVRTVWRDLTTLQKANLPIYSDRDGKRMRYRLVDGFRVGFIHGGMKPGSRDDLGTRLHAEQQFKDGAIQVLVATEAAGEGINLQCCHILFNCDIPWNPNRLEQRMGRIPRYGQTKDCLIFNFVATNTIEGRVLQRLLEKLQEIRDALDDDAVFNVVGEVLPAAHVERVLRDFYAGRLGEADLEDRLLRNVDAGHFRAICRNALEGLATKTLNLATSLDLNSGELRLIEVKGLGGPTGRILLTPNERRVAEDRRDCYWLYVVTDCSASPLLQEPVKDPARFPWHEVRKVEHYWLEVDALTGSMKVRQDPREYEA
jgi:hypothetical protein